MLQEITHECLLGPHADFTTEILPNMLNPRLIDIQRALTFDISLYHLLSDGLLQPLNSFLAW